MIVLLRVVYSILNGINPKLAWVLRHFHEGTHIHIVKKLSLKKGKIFIKGAGKNQISIPGAQKATDYVSQLHELLTYEGFNEIENGFVMQTNYEGYPLRFRFINFGNVFAYREIFLEGIYNIEIPKQNCIVVDIGMNIGLSSIFFASKKYVDKVYGFELLPSTFEIAKENINKNDWAFSKCVPISIGWGGKKQTLFINNSFEGSVQTSIRDGKIHDEKNGEKTQVEEASTILNGLLVQHTNQPFILKIDCEGAEYEILENLHNNNLITTVYAFMIEWHQLGPTPIIDLLSKNNFSTISFTNKEYGNSTGIIYAWNSNYNYIKNDQAVS